MPTITYASTPVTSFPNLFVSPYGNDGIIPLYSSVPLTYSPAEGCLPCVVCGNSTSRENIISEQSVNIQTSTQSGIQLATGV